MSMAMSVAMTVAVTMPVVMVAVLVVVNVPERKSLKFQEVFLGIGTLLKNYFLKRCSYKIIPYPCILE